MEKIRRTFFIYYFLLGTLGIKAHVAGQEYHGSLSPCPEPYGNQIGTAETLLTLFWDGMIRASKMLGVCASVSVVRDMNIPLIHWFSTDNLL
jgi:hypothetical protein